MKEIEFLIKMAEKYIKSSEILLNAEDYESSVSRLYYAMFYSVEALLLTEGLSFSSHKGVIAAFGKHFIKSGLFPKEMGKELDRAFEKRQLSDYEYNFAISRNEAEEMLQTGKNFVRRIISYLEEKKTL